MVHGLLREKSIQDANQEMELKGCMTRDANRGLHNIAALPLLVPMTGFVMRPQRVSAEVAVEVAPH